MKKGGREILFPFLDLPHDDDDDDDDNNRYQIHTFRGRANQVSLHNDLRTVGEENASRLHCYICIGVLRQSFCHPNYWTGLMA